jgi:hypothetical protein
MRGVAMVSMVKSGFGFFPSGIFQRRNEGLVLVVACWRDSSLGVAGLWDPEL